MKNSRQIILGAFMAYTASLFSQSDKPMYPTDIAISSKNEIVMTIKGGNQLDIFTPDGKTLVKTIQLDQKPTGVCLDGDIAYVTTFDTKGELCIVSLSTGTIEKRVALGSGACAPLLSADKKKLYVCNQFSDTVMEVDLNSGKVSRSTLALREPRSLVASKDGNYLFVANFLPKQRADVDVVSACVSVIKVDNFTKVKDIHLANGSNALRDICITPDGKYIYVSHNLGRFQVPTSQLQQGWMNTSAFSVIDVAKQEFHGAIVVDEPDRGAAGVWSIECDENSLYLTHSGTHELSVIDHKAMLRKFETYADKSTLDYDLNFLYGIRKRVPLEGNGPRAMAMANGKLYIPTYFADVMNFVDMASDNVSSFSMNPNRVESNVDKGEKYFNDATFCFQNWQSCNGCHPGEARTDGMNWDLMNDGVGNPKNCKSLLYSHITPPSMISGIRESAELAVRKGFTHIQFFNIDEEKALCVDDYLKQLRPVESPYLVNGELSDKAKAGKKVFDKLKCAECHSGPNYTDQKFHRIGEEIEFEKGWDTPTLIEVWRTAPYLFKGQAATLKEVFSVYKHGIDRKLSDKEIEELTEFVNSL